MLLRRALAALGKSLATTAVFLLLAEAGVRTAYFARNSLVTSIPLPYVMGDDYGPIPPWLDRLLILEPDNALLWKNTPGAHRRYVDIFSPVWRAEDRVALLRRFSPTLPAAFRGNPTWEISLNSTGDRGPDISRPRRPSSLRIACVGDSWTFGMNVDQDRTYPGRLEALLREHHPSADLEVLNFGVLGYSSFQGSRLLERRVLALEPDAVIIGFGMNDSEVAGYRDKDMPASGPPTVGQRWKAIPEHLEFYKLLRYLALVVTHRPQSTADALEAESRFKGSGTVDYDEIEPWVRVSPADYERNIRTMIGLARSRGARAVLVDNELWDQSPYRVVLRTVARDERVPLVDSLRIVADARKKMERDLEARLDLTTPGAPAPRIDTRPASDATRPAPGETEVVFRVYAGTYGVPKALSIVGAHPKLGSLHPNTVLMRDDGSEGDQRAGDGVWSYAASFPAGTHLFYLYTNSGRTGQWEGLDVPAIRQIDVPPEAGGPFYPPIDSFGKIYMQADNWHTDAAGYDLIARAVAAAIDTTGLFGQE